MNTLTEHSWLNTLIQRLPNILTLIFIILVSIILAKIVWLFLTPTPQIVLPASYSPSSKIDETQQNKQNYAQMIANSHLFGKPNVNVKAPAPKKTVPPPTPKKTITPVSRLNIKIKGLITLSKKQAFALIVYQGKDQKWEVGQDLYTKKPYASEITLLSVSEHDEYFQLEIDNKGKKEFIKSNKKTRANEVLKFLKGEEHALKPPRNRTKPQNIHNFLTGTTNEPPIKNHEKDAPPGRPIPEAPPIPPQVNLGKLHKEILQNPMKAIEIMRIQPVSSNGKFSGVRISPGKNKQAFDALKLKAGDVIIEINGEKLTNPATGMQAMNKLRESKSNSISIKVKRGGQIITIDHTF